MNGKPAATTKIDWNIINGLRGLAALYVVINHSRGQLFSDAMKYAEAINPKENWSWWEWLNMMLMQHSGMGLEFVILFFVLSGFSIAHSLANPQPIGKFYKRRLIRLYPTYLLGIIWCIVVFMICRYVSPDVYYNGSPGMDKPLKVYFDAFMSLPSLISNLLYVPVNNYLSYQYWSLPLEVIFYLLAPFVLKYLRWYGVITLALYAASWMIYGVVVKGAFDISIPFQFLFDYGIYFLAGVLIYRYRVYLLERFTMPVWLMVLTLLALFEIAVIMKAYLFEQTHARPLGLIMIVFSYIILLGSLKHQIHIRWLEKIGVYSYTLYVTHIATIHIINSISFYYGIGYYDIHKLWMWYIGIAFSVLMGRLLYWVAEYPSTKYLERRRKKIG